MKKQPPKAAKLPNRTANRDRRPRRRPPTGRARLDPLESALAAAALLAEPYPEEVESIDNVIRFVRDHRHGQPAEVLLSDLLLALSILLGTIDRDLTQEERDMLAALELALRIPTRAGVVHLPAAAAPPPCAPLMPLTPYRHAAPASCCAAPPTTASSPIPYVRLAA